MLRLGSIVIDIKIKKTGVLELVSFGAAEVPGNLPLWRFSGPWTKIRPDRTLRLRLKNRAILCHLALAVSIGKRSTAWWINHPEATTPSTSG